MFKNMHSSMRNAFLAIGLIFVGLFAATYYTFKVALRDGPIEVVDKNYYQVGLNYEKTIEDKRVLKAQGYHFEILSSDLKIGENVFLVQFKKGTEFLSGREGFLLLERGATDKYNRKIPLKSDENGYTAKLNIPSGGKWVVTLVLNESGKDFTESFVFQVD